MKQRAAAAVALICAFACSSCYDSVGESTGSVGGGQAGADAGGGAQDIGGAAGDAGTGTDDTGAPGDAGEPPEDGGEPHDADQPDAGQASDAGAQDAGQQTDAGGSDAGQPGDTGGGTDTGTVADPFLLEAQFVPGLAIDGDLSDWPATGCADLGPADYHQLTRPIAGGADLSARVCIAWSQTHLYLSARVTDDAHRNQEAPGSLWAGDSLQVALDADFDRTPGAYDSDGDYEYGFAMLSGGSAKFRFQAPAGSSDGTQLGFARNGQVSTYEVAIPFADLAHLNGASGERFGLSFLVNDDDLDGREGWVEWTRGIGEGKDPSAFGRAVLVGTAGADAGTGTGTDAGVVTDAGGVPDGGTSFNSRYGINTHLPAGNDLVRLYDKVAAAGIDWVRIDFNWELAEPSQDKFNWGPFDAVINAAHDRGLHVFATLAYSPAWANGGQDNSHPAVNDADWYDFCFKAAQRYDGSHGQPKVEHWGMWNEPDHTFFTGTVDDYVDKVLIPGSNAVHAANAGAKVCGPELAHKPDFLTAVLARGKDYIDVITIHKYSGTVADVMKYFDGTHWPWEDKNIKEILEGAGVFGSKPVWFTEAGWPTDPAWTCWFGDRVSEADQARLYADLLGALASRAWIEKVFFYEMIDANIPDACQWGILRNDYGEKQAYGAYRDYITAHPPAP